MKPLYWLIAVGVILTIVIIYFAVDIKKISSTGSSSSGSGSGSTDSPGSNGGNGSFTAANARTFALALYNAMKGLGTDEDAIWAALNNRPQDQRNMIRDSFNQLLAEKHESGDLISWFNDELSGEDLQKALAYFP